MPDRTRPIRKEICLNEQELSVVRHKMNQLGTHNFGGMHNDIVTMYIELGFWGFAFWIWLSWQGKIVWCQKAHGTKTAFLLLYCTIYAFVTYATDNTAFYCYINTVFMLLPIGYAMKQQDANEENDEHEETPNKQTTKPPAAK